MLLLDLKALISGLLLSPVAFGGSSLILFQNPVQNMVPEAWPLICRLAFDPVLSRRIPSAFHSAMPSAVLGSLVPASPSVSARVPFRTGFRPAVIRLSPPPFPVSTPLPQYPLSAARTPPSQTPGWRWISCWDWRTQRSCPRSPDNSGSCHWWRL